MINRKRTAYIVAVCVFVIACVCVAVIRFGFAGDGVVIDPETYYPVTYVVDGDTFKVKVESGNTKGGGGGSEADAHIITVRVLGINTPETVDPRKSVECYGPEASVEAKDLLNGRKVKLTFNPNRELKDKYGRYLAYVYRDDGLFYNEVMIKEGYAREYTYGSAYSMQGEFRDIEATAQKSKAGLWSACGASTKK